MTQQHKPQNDAKAAKNVRFAAIDKYIDKNIVLPTEKASSGDDDMVTWGENNGYPEYLLDLYKNVATLRSIINGCVDFVTGDSVTANVTPQENGEMNLAHESARDIVMRCAESFYHYGGFALQVTRDLAGRVAEIIPLDLRYVRANKDFDVFYYSEDFGKKYTRSANMLTYPAFMPNADHPISVLFVKNTTTQVYPAPLYAASVKACETERAIDDFHLNSIKNGFVPSVIINFNNGEPEDPIKDESEKDVKAKYCSPENAGRPILSFNKDKDSAATFEVLKTEDFGDKYAALAKHCRQQIFTSFRANPNLFGIPTENLGFSAEEYASSFALFNRTEIVPVQQMIVDALDYILGTKGAVTIEPFSLLDEAEGTLADRVDVEQLVGIVTNAALTQAQKRNILITAYGLTEEEAASFLPTE